ncbi:MAG: hypothetical protein ACLUUO_14485 [Sellimonas intestinalis]
MRLNLALRKELEKEVKSGRPEEEQRALEEKTEQEQILQKRQEGSIFLVCGAGTKRKLPK